MSHFMYRLPCHPVNAGELACRSPRCLFQAVFQVLRGLNFATGDNPPASEFVRSGDLRLPVAVWTSAGVAPKDAHEPMAMLVCLDIVVRHDTAMTHNVTLAEPESSLAFTLSSHAIPLPLCAIAPTESIYI